jgi:hypothetical protein
MEMKPDIELHIEELVLHGVSRSNARRLGAAVEVELGRMLTEQGLPARLRSGAEIGAIDAGQLSLGATARPESTGAAVAKAVYGGLAHGR